LTARAPDSPGGALHLHSGTPVAVGADLGRDRRAADYLMHRGDAVATKVGSYGEARAADYLMHRGDAVATKVGSYGS
jgi:hypothetical protein